MEEIQHKRVPLCDSIVIKHKNSQSQSMEAEVKIEVTLGTADR